MKKCPQCAEEVQVEAKVCRFCKHEFEPQRRMSSAQAGCLVLMLALFAILTIAQCSRQKPSTPTSPQADVNRAQAYQTTPSGMLPGARTGPAPKGYPKAVAKTAIDKAGHKCGEVTGALRIPSDGSIIATCANGKRFRVFELRDAGILAMNCEAATKLIGEDACQVP